MLSYLPILVRASLLLDRVDFLFCTQAHVHGDAWRAEGVEQDDHQLHVGCVSRGPQDARGIPQARAGRPVKKCETESSGGGEKPEVTTPSEEKKNVFLAFIVVTPCGGGPSYPSTGTPQKKKKMK